MVKEDIKCLERGIQEMNSGVWQINEAIKDIHDTESITVLSMAIQLVNSIVNKTSEKMNKRILEDEADFKRVHDCCKTVRCFICNKKENGECQK